MNEKEVIVLNDDEIVQLYFERSEESIAQSEEKYGRCGSTPGIPFRRKDRAC